MRVVDRLIERSNCLMNVSLVLYFASGSVRTGLVFPEGGCVVFHRHTLWLKFCPNWIRLLFRKELLTGCVWVHVVLIPLCYLDGLCCVTVLLAGVCSVGVRRGDAGILKHSRKISTVCLCRVDLRAAVCVCVCVEASGWEKLFCNSSLPSNS